MLFSYVVKVPANTTEKLPFTLEMPVSRGVIHKWVVYIPSGHWGEAHLSIWHGSTPLLPTNPGGWIHGDEFSLPGDDFLYLKTDPYILTAKAYNEDTKYQHSFFVYIWIKPLWTFTPFAEHYMTLLEQDELAKVVI